jgi:integrase
MGVRPWTDAKKRRRYAVEFEIRGHRVFRRLPAGSTKGQATAYEARLRHDFIDQAVVGQRPNVTIGFAIDEWLEEVVTGRKSEDETKSKAGIVKKACGNEPFGRIAAARASVIKAGKGKAPATINRRLCVLKAVAKFGWRKGWSSENESGKIALLPGEVARARHIPEAKIRALIRKAPDFETKAFIAFAGYAGLRQGEVMALTAQDVSGSRILLADTKTGKARTVPVVAPLRPFLAAIPLTSHKRTLYARFEAARDAAGIRNLVYHDLRRSAATILYNSGADITTVAAILGNTPATASKVYAQVLDRTAKGAMNRAFPPSGRPSLRAINGKKA